MTNPPRKTGRPVGRADTTRRVLHRPRYEVHAVAYLTEEQYQFVLTQGVTVSAGVRRCVERAMQQQEEQVQSG